MSSQRIVVDASIARSAGGIDATHPTSIASRDCLKSIQDRLHLIVMSADIYGEWKKHRSRFAMSWLRTMTAKKLCYKAGGKDTHDLLVKLKSSSQVNISSYEIMEKDIHLLIAALESDKRILALDDTARLCFAASVNICPAINSIYWSNPVNTHDRCFEWIKNDLPPDNNKLLCNYSN